MPLWMLIVIVAAGLTLVIGAVHVFGGKRAGSLDQNLAREIWLREFSEGQIAEVLVSDDRMMAIIALNDTSELGLVRQMGAHHIARRLEPGAVNRVWQSGDAIDLRLYDATVPRVRIAMADERQCSEAMAMLEKLVAKKGQNHA